MKFAAWVLSSVADAHRAYTLRRGCRRSEHVILCQTSGHVCIRCGTHWAHLTGAG